MIITITGKEGSGSTSMAHLLRDKLGYDFYYAGGRYREEAKKKYHKDHPGEELKAANRHDNDPNTAYEDTIDIIVDNEMKELAQREKDYIIEGRTALNFTDKISKARGIPIIHIYVDVDENTGAQRVYVASLSDCADRGGEPKYADVKAAKVACRERFETDSSRYERFYGGWNPHDPRAQYGIRQDSTRMTKEQQWTDLKKSIIALLRKEKIAPEIIESLS